MAAAPSDGASLQSHISKFSNIAGMAGYVFCPGETAKIFGLITPRRLRGVIMLTLRRLTEARNVLRQTASSWFWTNVTDLCCFYVWLSSQRWSDSETRERLCHFGTECEPNPRASGRSSPPQPNRRVYPLSQSVKLQPTRHDDQSPHSVFFLLQIKPPAPWTRRLTGAASRRSVMSSTRTRMGEVLMDHTVNTNEEKLPLHWSNWRNPLILLQNDNIRPLKKKKVTHSCSMCHLGLCHQPPACLQTPGP